MALITRAYDVGAGARRHPLRQGEGLMAVSAAVLGVWSQSVVCVLSVAVVAAAISRRTFGLLTCLLIGLAGAWRSQDEWRDAVPRQIGHYSGWVTVVGDPAPFGSGLRVTVEIDGQRFDAWTYGSPRRRLVDRQAGDSVFVQGTRRLMTSNARRAQIRHVVGQLDVDVVGDWRDGSRLYRTSSRVRSALRRVAESTIGGAGRGPVHRAGDRRRRPRTGVDDHGVPRLGPLTSHRSL